MAVSTQTSPSLFAGLSAWAELGLAGWTTDNSDPDNFLYVLFHSDNAHAGAQNIAFYRNAGVDVLILDAQGASDDLGATVVSIKAGLGDDDAGGRSHDGDFSRPP